MHQSPQSFDCAAASEIEKIDTISTNGIITKRDKLVIDFDNKALLDKIKAFADLNISNKDISVKFKLPLQDKDKWNLNEIAVLYGPPKKKEENGNTCNVVSLCRLLYDATAVRPELLEREDEILQVHGVRAGHPTVGGACGQATTMS